MKRWIIFTVLIVVLSAGGTVAVQYLPTTGSETDLPIALGKAVISQTNPQGSPKLELSEDPIFEFGTLPQRTTGKHAWTVKNTGTGDLEIWMISSTCSCTLAKFKDGQKAVVKPGESTEIVLEYETRENNGEYIKGADIGSNDPSMASFPLKVKGKVFPAVLTFPPEPTINLSTISNDKDEYPFQFAVYSRDRPETKIVKIEASTPNILSSHADLKTEELQSLPPQIEAKRGESVSVKVKTGLPLGPFREELIITTDHPAQPELRLTIVGRMIGPVNVVPAPVTMHEVYGSAGATAESAIVVREQRPTKIEVIQKPKHLQVEVAPVEGNRPGRYRLIVTVPPGTPAERIEDDIVLKTDHPKADKLSVPVSIWILNAN